MRASQFADLSAWRLPNKEFHKGRNTAWDFAVKH
jgi:hypothetical protein